MALRQMKDNLDDALTEPFLTALDGEAERLVETANGGSQRSRPCLYRKAELSGR